METDAESRLRRFLAAYERLCKKYSLIVGTTAGNYTEQVMERIDKYDEDSLPENLAYLREGGISE